MNPISRILVSIALGAAIILSLIFFAAGGVVIAVLIGIWLLIGRIRHGGTSSSKSSDGWFRIITIRSGDNNGQGFTTAENQHQQADIVDISPDDYSVSETDTSNKAIDVLPEQRKTQDEQSDTSAPNSERH